MSSNPSAPPPDDWLERQRWFIRYPAAIGMAGLAAWLAIHFDGGHWLYAYVLPGGLALWSLWIAREAGCAVLVLAALAALWFVLDVAFGWIDLGPHGDAIAVGVLGAWLFYATNRDLRNAETQLRATRVELELARKRVAAWAPAPYEPDDEYDEDDDV